MVLGFGMGGCYNGGMSVNVGRVATVVAVMCAAASLAITPETRADGALSVGNAPDADVPTRLVVRLASPGTVRWQGSTWALPAGVHVLGTPYPWMRAPAVAESGAGRVEDAPSVPVAQGR